ncbi:histidinol-phosphatase [Pleomorphovibrio marinus]|uniref:histidinol-phosphatase n=1 Tax=Pleomorphovibrio marinus TaxID=2164132 RepID=UPI001E645928|nr:histidinol-phosphatase [Pleomorphovibrio marinus]
MDWYKDQGYHFVALSDHNIFAEGEKWITLREDSIYQEGFKQYLSEFGRDWVDYKEEEEGKTQVRLKTFEEYVPLFEEAGRFIMIPSEEISDGFEGKPLHLNVTNLQKLIEPQKGESVVDVLQRNINAVLEQRRETGEPMMVHINHPNFRWAITMEDMMKLKGERFFEVFNGHPQVHNLGDAERPGTEEMWDFINIAYLEKGQPLLFGLATDDSHNYHVTSSQLSNAGRGWVVIRTDSLAIGNLIDALEEGEYYASTGVELKDFSYEGHKFSVEVAAEQGAEYTISFIGCKKGEKETRILEEVKGTSASFEVEKDMLFVRAKVVSSLPPDNPIENMSSQMAWLQPVRPE